MIAQVNLAVCQEKQYGKHIIFINYRVVAPFRRAYMTRSGTLPMPSFSISLLRQVATFWGEIFISLAIVTFESCLRPLILGFAIHADPTR